MINALEIGDNTITVQDTQMGDVYALPTNADETVTYTITIGANGVIVLNTGDVYMDEGETIDITVPAGETVTLNVGAYSFSDNVATVNLAIKE